MPKPMTASASDAAENRTRSHHGRVVPQDQTRHGEICGRDAVHARRQQALHAVHVMDVGIAHDAQRREHEDADSGPEVAAVDSDQELEDGREPQPRSARGRRQLEPPLNRFLRHEQAGGEQNQRRHETVEELGRGAIQQYCPQHASEQARQHQHPDMLLGIAELTTVAPDAAERARPERDGAGGVGRNRGHTQPDQGGKRQQGAAAGD
jgi:hypothetical protein